MEQDRINLEKQYNNFIYPKPVINIEKEIINKKIIPYADPNFSWHILWPEKKNERKSINILIAGCGSDQAAIIAKCNPIHNIIGIDISAKSIEHQNYLKNKHKISNLTLICDDFRLIKFTKKFDYIISTGVIHHLIDPNTALNTFYKNLKDDGVINLMVYGNKQSDALNQLKNILKELNLSHDQESINIAKNTILNLNNEHPAKIFANSLNDINHNSGIIDLLLNNQESFFDLSQLISLLNKNNFIIKNFFDGKINSLTKFFLNDDKSVLKLRKLKIDKKLLLGQVLNWNDRMIELVISKKNQQKNSLIYGNIDIMECYYYPNRSIRYKINDNNIEVEEIHSKKIYTYKFSSKLNWHDIFAGKKKLCDILFNQRYKKQSEVKYNFEILVENKHIDLSFNPIVNYIDYLAK